LVEFVDDTELDGPRLVFWKYSECTCYDWADLVDPGRQELTDAASFA
jgi:hypothetical protein